MRLPVEVLPREPEVEGERFAPRGFFVRRIIAVGIEIIPAPAEFAGGVGDAPGGVEVVGVDVVEGGAVEKGDRGVAQPDILPRRDAGSGLAFCLSLTTN